MGNDVVSVNFAPREGSFDDCSCVHENVAFRFAPTISVSTVGVSSAVVALAPLKTLHVTTDPVRSTPDEGMNVIANASSWFRHVAMSAKIVCAGIVHAFGGVMSLVIASLACATGEALTVVVCEGTAPEGCFGTSLTSAATENKDGGAPTVGGLT